ncbi:hypothetical protein SPLC1_S202520 [Arthrospira platensis C1]|nr:hypothetical protein SPLC1_S202520 [Arthrospira platensis C1]
MLSEGVCQGENLKKTLNSSALMVIAFSSSYYTTQVTHH